MQTAITSGYCPQTKKYIREELSAQLKAVADAGITHVHWSYQWGGDYLFGEDEIAYAQRLLKEYSLATKGIHAAHGWAYGAKREGMYKWLPQAEGQTDIASFDESLRKKGSELVRNRLRLAEALDTREIVLHVQIPYVRFSEPGFKEKYYSRVLKTLDENETYARERGTRICIENMVGTPNALQFEEFDILFNHFSPEYIGYCCDTGHGNLTDPLDPFCLPRKYINRLYAIHLNDNHGYKHPGDFSDDADMSCSDEHYVMGDATLDFDSFAEILAQSPYELPVVGEFNVHNGEPIGQYLNRSRERMEVFTEKVLALRDGK